MARFVSDDKVLAVQQATDIVELLSEYIPLKRAGTSYKALCPFHDEKTPSFVVSPTKQIYHCFGCGKGGNVFTFLMAFEKLEFPEALRMLAERSGIKFALSKEDKFSRAKRAELLKTNRITADYYHKLLLESKTAEVARKYLKQRGFSQGTIARFLLGCAPNDWDQLVNHARQHRWSTDGLLELGLIAPRRDTSRGSYYNKFRNRVMFPIFNTRDRVIGFGGRALDKETVPVYLNSPESYLFNKSKILYGLNFAKEVLSKTGKLCIVEGYTDVLMAHQSGLEFVVATLGTALTADHIKTIRRYVDKVILAYDADKAGAIASARTLDLFLTEDINLYIAQLPSGLDPYDCIVKKGPDVFKRCLDDAKDLFSYRVDWVKTRYDLKDLNQKTLAIDELLKSIQAVPNIVKRNLQLKQLAEALQVTESLLRLRLAEKTKPKWQQTRNQTAKQENAVKLVNLSEVRAAEQIIETMLAQNQLIPQIRQTITLTDLPTPQSAQVVQEIFNLYERYGKVTVDTLSGVLSAEPDLANWVVKIAADNAPQTPQVDHEKSLADCLSFLERRRKKILDMPQLTQLIKKAQAQNDKQEVDRLLIKYQELQRSLRSVVSQKAV